MRARRNQARAAWMPASKVCGDPAAKVAEWNRKKVKEESRVRWKSQLSSARLGSPERVYTEECVRGYPHCHLNPLHDLNVNPESLIE